MGRPNPSDKELVRILKREIAQLREKNRALENALAGKDSACRQGGQAGKDVARGGQPKRVPRRREVDDVDVPEGAGGVLPREGGDEGAGEAEDPQ